MGGRRKGACPVGIVQDLAAAFEVAWDPSGDGPLGSILPSAGLAADRRKASGDTLNLWFSEPLSLTVGRMLRLSPVLSFRPTEIDAAAAVAVKSQWEKLTVELRGALGQDFLRKFLEESIGKVRQFIGALRDFGTRRSGQHPQEVYARSVEAWGVQISGCDDGSPYYR